MIIRIWVYDGILASGVAGPVDIFAVANSLAAKEGGNRRAACPIFTWSIESIDGQPVRSASGQSIAVDRKIESRTHADAILVTAPFVATMDTFMQRRSELSVLFEALRHQHAAGAVLASYCTGNYLLAEAGLLNGRPATTHWSKARDFARRYPKVELRANEILAEQDGILSGGGVTSYLDLALRLVDRLASRALAITTANMLLIDMNRLSQAPYASLIEEHGHDDRLVARAQRQMEAMIQQGTPLSELAAFLSISERTLNRRFKRALGVGPLEYLQTVRIEVAKRLLEAGALSIEGICLKVGYSDPSTFRALFKRRTGLSPREYQRGFIRSQLPEIRVGNPA